MKYYNETQKETLIIICMRLARPQMRSVETTKTLNLNRISKDLILPLEGIERYHMLVGKTKTEIS